MKPNSQEADCAFKIISKYIKDNDYTFNVFDILNGYKRKKIGYYISFVMNDYIQNLDKEIKIILGE